MKSVAPHRYLSNILMICMLTGSVGLAQTPASDKIQPVTTTVLVQGHVSDDYLPTTSTVGSLDIFDTLPLAESPLSASVVTRNLLTDQFARVLSDVVKNDASIGEDYAPVGYYGDFQIRGFTLDLATGLQINGQVIAGEQDVPLENKERVELLKGIAGVESGVTSAGGLINYVTKRPALVQSAELATDHRGTAFAAVDLGRLFGARKQAGARINLAAESIQSYVQSTHGWRGVGAASADWRLTDKASLKSDFEFQHKRQRSVAGYQLLGGTALPDIKRLHTSTMLADQPWSKPNIFDTFNAGSRLDLDLPAAWKLSLSGSYSHSLIDDNVIYPYGAAYDEAGNSLCPDSPYYFYCPDGSYQAYDYRSPLELRIDATGQAIAAGRLKTGKITHNLVFGGSLFDRLVELSPTIIYDPIGPENIYQPNIIYTEKSYQAPGPSIAADFNRQSSAILQDRIELPFHIRLTAATRYASVADFNFNGHKKGVWLPQFAATWSPLATLTAYANSSVLLSLGPQAPFWVVNASSYLAPFHTRQTELGIKFQPGSRLLLTASAYRMRAPFFYPKQDDSAGGLVFLSQGHETHRGIELSAQGKAAPWLRLSASAAAILAQGSNTGTPAYDSKQVINVPEFKLTTFADIALPHTRFLGTRDLHLLPGYTFSGSKQATRDDSVSVPCYHLFSLGARYAPGGEEGRVSFRIFADNLFNRRYWKDTGASYGDTFVHLGAPATVRASASYRF